MNTVLAKIKNKLDVDGYTMSCYITQYDMIKDMKDDLALLIGLCEEQETELDELSDRLSTVEE